MSACTCCPAARRWTPGERVCTCNCAGAGYEPPCNPCGDRPGVPNTKTGRESRCQQPWFRVAEPVFARQAEAASGESAAKRQRTGRATTAVATEAFYAAHSDAAAASASAAAAEPVDDDGAASDASDGVFQRPDSLRKEVERRVDVTLTSVLGLLQEAVDDTAIPLAALLVKLVAKAGCAAEVREQLPRPAESDGDKLLLAERVIAALRKLERRPTGLSLYKQVLKDKAAAAAAAAGAAPSDGADTDDEDEVADELVEVEWKALAPSVRKAYTSKAQGTVSQLKLSSSSEKLRLFRRQLLIVVAPIDDAEAARVAKLIGLKHTHELWKQSKAARRLIDEGHEDAT